MGGGSGVALPGVDDGNREYLNYWLHHGGGLAIYGSYGKGGQWLDVPMGMARAAGYHVKVLDLVDPAGCHGMPPPVHRLTAGIGLAGLDWMLAENIAAVLTEHVSQKRTVLCIRNFEASFLVPATKVGGKASAVLGLFRAARREGFPICVAMTSAHVLDDLLRSFAWVWCLGFDRQEHEAVELQVFARAAQLAAPESLWRFPPLMRNKALVVKFGDTRTHIVRREVDVEGLFSAGSRAA